MRLNELLIDPEATNASGVYVIANLASEKLYIGSSAKLRNRLTTHIWLLRNNRHKNAHLQAAWNKYGEDAFMFAPLQYAPVDDLESVEQGMIDKYRDVAYNLREVSSSNRGIKFSEETRRKISESSKAQWDRPEYRERMLAVIKNRELSPEGIAKMAATKRGKRLSEEHRQAMRDAVRKPPPERSEVHRAALGASRAKTYVVTSPEGVEQTVTNLREFCRSNSLQQSHMGKVARGVQDNHKGWLCRYDAPKPEPVAA